MFAEESLYLAWIKVKQNNGCAGVDGVGIDQFGLNLVTQLGRLQAELMAGIYKPQGLLRVYLKKGGKRRPLSIPTVRDRVAQTAVAMHLTPIFEPMFEEVSFAYRRGRSVQQAIKRVVDYYQQGYRWVVDADIASYFDEVDHAALLELLKDHLETLDATNAQVLLGLIKQWLHSSIVDGQHTQRNRKGIPQGSPLSPLLANVYLDQLDDALLGRNKKWCALRMTF